MFSQSENIPEVAAPRCPTADVWDSPSRCSAAAPGPAAPRAALRSAPPPPPPRTRTRVETRLTSSQSRASSVGFMSLFDENELLRSHWYLYWGHIAYKQEACSLSGENFFMSETENSCSRLCHPFFSRQKIPKSCNQRSLHLIDKATNKPKCLSTSTAACQTSSIATRCPV